MKKYLSILVAVMLAAMSFTLTSCGDDEPDPVPGTIVDEDDNGDNNDNDDPNNPQEIEELLIGTWQNPEAFEPNRDYLARYIQFKNNGSCLQIFEFEDGELYVNYGTWSLKGNTLYTTFETDLDAFEPITTALKILALNEKTLELDYGMLGVFSFNRVPDSTIDKYL